MILTELISLFPEEKVKTEGQTNHLLGNNGEMTVFPTTEEEITQVLKFADQYGKKVSIIGGGTKRGFGGLTEYADIQLSLAHYTGITEHTPGDMTVTVKAGTTFKELQDYLAKHRQKVSLDPSWPEYSTIGGIIASNESGPKRLGYGSSRDSVIGLRIVYPDGQIIRSGGKVVKNVAGYDMNKLFIGSMGTLGVVTEITLKLRPIPKYESLILLSFPIEMQEEMSLFVINLLDSMMEPIALELLSPALSNRLTHKEMYTLAISFEDFEPSVRYQEEFIKSIVPDGTLFSLLPQAEAELFWDAFYKTAPSGISSKPGSVTEAALKIGVKNLDVFQIVKECASMHKSVLIEAHGGLGHGLCQVTLRGSSNDVMNAIERIQQITARLGGYTIIKHLPYALRHKTEVWGEKPSYFFLIQGIKAAIDPKSILNNKRYLGGI
ncbi:FAD-binding oxidoreductase [Metabacillus idriensis]|uniref:FAD-binding oxidoreductase n=1 Tax=Metabacillus idriensis TaxID=324768 RepID=UPI0028146D94|nr:FAD-binding oxidoreductase [Metabacillus idriensis]MDR0137584.1 FAD-binding oxidoreductase [Metabacillus idriensis]